MYSLLVGLNGNTAYGSRMLEYTEPAIEQFIRPSGQLDTSRLLNLPVLEMPEIGDAVRQVARVGHISQLVRQGGDFRYTFVPAPAIAEIPSEKVRALAADLSIDDWELRRTHWAVKDVDLYRVLGPAAAAVPASEVFKVPREPRAADLIAVMMPFDRSFRDVYSTLRDAATDAGMRCERVDDIWENNAIIDDVFSLIWRARAVICDLTGRNPNVFYETGIAHTLGRPVIPITQSAHDIPFDIQHLRYVTYLNNSEGLADLKPKVTQRLTALASRVA